MVLAPTRSVAFIEEAREFLPLIRRNAAEAEAQGRMTDEIVEAFGGAGFRRMMVAPELGGGGMRIPDVIPVTQLLASADGSTGWSLMFAMLGPMFGQLLERAAYDEIFSDPTGTIAGALAPMSVAADETAAGYVVSGKSSYNSAHRFATHLFFGGMVRKDGQVALNNGAPEIRGFVVRKQQATIVPNWPATAMVATESDDAVIQDALVPKSYSFPFFTSGSSWRGGAESVIPLASMAAVGLASIAVGTARGALDAFREMAHSKVPAASVSRLADQAGAQIALAEAEGIWLAANAVLHDTVNDVWQKADAGESFGLPEMAHLRLATVTATRLSKRAVDLVRDFSGMSVVLKGSPIERFCRDIGAVTQHVAVAAPRFQTVGRVLLGLPPESLII